jgi:hypothetical protein
MKSYSQQSTVVPRNWLDNFLMGGGYIAHFAMYAALENRDSQKREVHEGPPLHQAG